MFPIQDVDDVMLAFPANVLHMMPDYEVARAADIPDVWKTLVSDWFYSKIEIKEMKPKEGVDPRKAMRHISAIMRSFEPKHEHKEAAVAYLLNEWFDSVEYERKER